MNAFDEQWRKKKKKEDEIINSESSGGSDDFDALWKKKANGSFPEIKKTEAPAAAPSQEAEAEQEKKDERGFFEKAKDTLLGLFGAGKEAEDDKQKKLDAISSDQGADENARKPKNVQLKDDEYVKTVGTVAQMLKEAEEARIKAETDLAGLEKVSELVKTTENTGKIDLKKKEIANLRESEKIYRDFLGKDTEDNGFFRGIVDGADNPAEALLPFAKAGRETANLIQTKQILDKYKNGEDLDDYEKSVVQTFKAKMIDGFIDRGLGYNVGNMLVNMPAYMLEFAMTAGTFKVGKAIAQKAVEKAIIPEIGKKIVANSVGAIAQGSVMVPRISAGMAENMLPSAQLVEGEDGSFNVDIVQDGDGWGKALGKSYLSTVIETASERVGSVVEKPMEFIQKATLAKWAKLRGLKSSKELNDLANKVGWNGIVGEVFEEEIGEMAQAPVEERNYNAPLLTPEGTQRLLVETLGITAFSGIAKVTDASIQGIIKYREKNNMDDVVDIPVKSESAAAGNDSEGINGNGVVNTLPDVIKQEFEKKESAESVEMQSPTETKETQPVSDKYFTASKGENGKMKFKEVDAEPVEIIENIDTFLEENAKGWGVREGRTGTLISQGYFQTKDEAVESTRSKMESAGLEKVQQNIDLLVQKHGESPRYAKVETQEKQERWPTTPDEYDSSIEKRVEKFRKDAGLVASREGAGVRMRNVEDAVGNVNFVAKDFSLKRAKGDMKRRAEDMRQYARELLYENDEEFRRMVEERDALRAKEIDESDDEVRIEEIFGELSRQEEEISRNIEQYETGSQDEQGKTQEDKGSQGEGEEKTGGGKKEKVGEESVGSEPDTSEDASETHGEGRVADIQGGESNFYEQVNGDDKTGELKRDFKDLLVSPLKLKYERDGYFSFPNEKVESPADIAFAFRELKNEAIEKFYVVGTKNDKPVSIECISVGSMNSSLVDPFETVGILLRKGADGAYLVHNHPSGVVTPSPEDTDVTRRLSKGYKNLGIEFKGHIIIDTTKFGLIGKSFEDSQEDQMTDVKKPVKFSAYRKYVEWLTNKPSDFAIGRPADIANVIKGLNMDDQGNALLIFTDNRNQVLSVQPISKDGLDVKTITPLAAETRSRNIFIANHGLNADQIRSLKEDLSYGLNIEIRDAIRIHPDGSFVSAMAEGVIRDSGAYEAYSKKAMKISPEERAARDEMTDAVSMILFDEEKWKLIIRRTGQGMTDFEDFGALQDLRNDLEKSGKADFDRIRNAVEILAKYNLPVSDMLFPASAAMKASVTTNILNKLGSRKTVSRQFIADLTNSADVRQVERDMIREALKGFGDTVAVREFKDQVQSQLLPLNRVDSKDGEPMYEHVVLSDDIRGDVADYYESVYESPVSTGAGRVHFGVDATKNYFAHTRTEDMADGQTRRIVEVQSDLFQKGRLEQEKSGFDGMGGYRTPDKNVSMLEPYRNVWWERIVREELKQAAVDGKSVLLFPTGETAMLVEGLGGFGSEGTIWHVTDKYGRAARQITPHTADEDIEVGMELKQGLGSNWIVTDALGGGRFKAVPKDIAGMSEKDFKIQKADYNDGRYVVVSRKSGVEVESLGSSENEQIAMGRLKNYIQNTKDSRSETFDISGKVDTNNPIYRFYEKDVQKFLKRIRPDLKTITDENGVTWLETKVIGDDAKNPVLAFYDAQSGSFLAKNGVLARGAEDIKGRLRDEVKKGGLKREEYAILERFVDRLAKNLGDVGLSLEESGEGQGVFNYADAVVTLFKRKIKAKDAGMPRVMIHELWHSLSRYLPEKDLQAVNGLFERERKEFAEKHPEIEAKLEAMRNESKEATLSKDEMQYYRYLNVDEFFAETMTDHSLEEIGREFNLERSHLVYRILEHIKRVIRSMIESVADILGYEQTKVIFRRFYAGKNSDMIHWLSFDLRNNELMKEEDPMRQRMVLVWSELLNSEERLTKKGNDLLEKFNRREANEKDVALAIDALKEIGVDAEVSMSRYIETKLNKKGKGVKKNFFSLFQDAQEARKTVEEKDIKAVEFPELVALARKLTGKVPEIKKLRAGERGHFQAPDAIRLDADIFKDPVLAAKVLAHEVGHLADYLPDHNLRKGNVVARIASLRKFMKRRFGDLDDKVLRSELYVLSKEWRPFDEASASQNYMRYRKSAAELYADAISALFNQPELLKEKAPHFWRGFFDYMDEKPEAKATFFDTWELLTMGEEAVLKSRQERIEKMFSRAEDEYTAKNLERKQRRKEYWFRFKQEFIDVNHKLIDKVREAEKRGDIIKDEDNPEYLLNENNYIGGEIKAWIEEHVSPIYKKLMEKDISWEDFGQMLFLERVANERGDLANPLGFQKATAEAQLEYFKKVLGEDRFSILQESAEVFRNGVKSVLDAAETSGIYSKDVVERLRANPAYATYQVVDYLDLNLPAGVRQQKGTLKDIANPATATVMKTISVIRAAERNLVKGKTIGFLKEHHSEDIKPAKTMWNGKNHEPIPSKNKDEALLMVMEEGKLNGYYVDPYIADSFDYASTGGMNVMIRVLQFFNSKYFKPMYVVFNLGFQSFNFTRDFFRFYKNMPTYNPLKAAYLYLRAVPASFKRAAGITDDLILEMEKKRVLSITYNDILSGSTEEDKQIDRILEGVGAGILKKSRKKRWQKLLYPLVKVFGAIRATGDFIETLPKVAGYIELKDKLPEKEMANFIRTSIGSPDFLRKGKAYPFYNNVFLFANAIKEGVRADYNVAIRNPRTRSGYWVKTAIVTILPKLAMLMVLYGLFGDDEKKRMEDVSEYDLTNYLILTLFRDGDRTTYLRIPQDETGRLIGGLFWKFMQLGIKKDPEIKDATDILAYTGGQIPSASPIIDLMVSTFQYMNGKNPYDYFRGQTVVPDEEFKAGGMYAFKPYAFWVYNKLGLNNIYSISLYERPGDKDKPLNFMKNIPVIGNAAERWVKTSDAGQRERNREIIQNLERDASRQRLESREKINEKIREYKDGDQSIFRRRQLTRELVKDILGHPARTAEEKRKADNIDKKFRWGILRGEADSNIDAVLNSNTNDEKVAVLAEIRKKKSEGDFSEFIKYLKMNKVVSEAVIKELRKKK
jgi:DNA repair protein RadC